MRKQTRWRRVVVTALIGAGLALVGAGVVSAATPSVAHSIAANGTVSPDDAVWV